MEPDANPLPKSGGRETFWACLAGLFGLCGYAVVNDSAIAVQVLNITVFPVMGLGMATFGFHKLGGAWMARK